MNQLHTPNQPILPAKLDSWLGHSDQEPRFELLHIDSVDMSGSKDLDVRECLLEGCSLTEAKLERLEILDTLCRGLEAAAVQAYRTSCLRLRLESSRLSGANMPEAVFEDCVFKNVKLGGAGFRFARFKRVVFDSCVLRDTDFSRASFIDVRFTGCDLAGANFDGASCKRVDLSGEALGECKGILGLKGATISDEQLIQIAPLLAAELGFKLVA